jgi:hypothetical protein
VVISYSPESLVTASVAHATDTWAHLARVSFAIATDPPGSAPPPCRNTARCRHEHRAGTAVPPGGGKTEIAGGVAVGGLAMRAVEQDAAGWVLKVGVLLIVAAWILSGFSRRIGGKGGGSDKASKGAWLLLATIVIGIAISTRGG